MRIRNKLFDNIIMILCSCFTAFIFAPLEIFFMNSSKIWFDIYDLLFPVVVYFTGACVLAISVFLFFILIKKQKLADIYTYMLAGIVFIFYVIGSFVPVHISLVDDGESVNWLDLKYNAIHIFIIAILSLILVFVYRREKRQSIVKGVLLAVFGIQIFTLVTISLISPGDRWKHRNEMILSEKNYQTYSKASNIEILVLDEFDSRVMTELLNSDNSYISLLDGFTYYPDTASLYNFSDCSVTQMLTGAPYKHQTGFDEYLSNGYDSSYLINRLKGEYSLNIYDDIALLPADMADDLFDNYVQVKMKVSSKRTLMKYMYKLVGCKYLPFYFRQYCWFASDDLDELKYVENVDDSIDYSDRDITASPCTAANTAFYSSLDEIKVVDDKMFHWHHLRGIHGPRNHDAFMQEAENSDVMECAKGLMFMLDRWIGALKDKGVYDNSVILIVADHGTNLTPDETFRSANALFMVKGFNEHHDLMISDKKVSYSEMDDIYKKLLDGCAGDEAVTGLDENEVRYFYRGLDGYYADGDLIEYLIKEKASDVENVQETGVVYR